MAWLSLLSRAKADWTNAWRSLSSVEPVSSGSKDSASAAPDALDAPPPLELARALAREWECDGLFVHALAVNEVAERFYARAGFVVDSEEGAAEAARRGHCLDGVEGLGRSVLYRDATFL